MALAVALGWTAVPADAQTGGGAKPGAKGDPVVARVDGTEIKRSDLLAAQSVLPDQYRQLPLQSVFQPLLSRMINTILFVHAARAAKLQDDADVKKQLAAMERQILEQAYLAWLVESKITEAAVRERYEASIAGAKGEAEIRASHILVKTEAEATAVIDELRKSKTKFADLARKHSTGPSSTKGGDLGFFKKGRMVKEFSKAAFAMEPGEVTRKPVKTQFGWHVIKVTERRADSVPSFEDSRQRLTSEMTEQVIAEAVGSLRKSVRIETFQLDGSAPAPARIQRVQ
jgi:peptidyl-prolyl cis-trans isomerase C